MKKGMSKGSIRRKIALALTVCMSAGSAGCGKSEMTAVQESAPEPTVPAVSDNDISVSESAAREKIDDNGNPIWDFDEFVNGEWKKEQAAAGQLHSDEYRKSAEALRESVYETLEKTDVSKLSEEDGLFKVITFYNEIADLTDIENRRASLKTYLSEIEKVRTLDELYVLYRNERYAVLNDILRFTVYPDDGYKVYLEWTPVDLWAGEHEILLSGEEDGGLFYEVMEELGYSESQAHAIVENALEVADRINDYNGKLAQSGTIYRIKKDLLEEEGVPIPVIDILGDQYAAFCPEAFKPKLDGFYAAKDCTVFFSELYTPENLQKIKDFYVVSAVTRTLLLTNTEHYMEYYDLSADQLAKSIVSDCAEELLVQDYMQNNVNSETIDQCEAVLEEVKLSVRSVIDEAEWLSLHGREQARSKVLRIREFYGGDNAVNDFSDLQLTGDTFEDYISMRVSRDHFLKSQTADYRDERNIFDVNDYEVNAYYYPYYNAMIYTAGWLKYVQDAGAGSEEAKLGIIGVTMAHELGHAYDTNGSMYNSLGEYDPWMSEEEAGIYNSKTQQIADFLDGRETEYGKTIDGELVMDETFADLMAVECCLRILAEKEDPDYDAFFRAYARDKADYYTEEGLENALTDTHLPGKERINLVLGQFDQFYETYDIDESSPYYVKEADRLPVF